MKILVSDLHLGSVTYDSYRTENEFLLFLDYIGKKAEEIIFLGDIFELWRTDLEEILYKYSEVLLRMIDIAKKKKIFYIIGNHDTLPFIKYKGKDFGNFVISDYYYNPETSIWAEHGHRFDNFNILETHEDGYKKPAMAYISKFIGYLEKKGYKKFVTWIDEIEPFIRYILNAVLKGHNMAKKEYQHNDHYCLKGAEKLLKERKVKTVIMGHTHKWGLEELKNGLYINSGSWIGKEIPIYLAIFRKKIEVRNGINHKVIEKLIRK